MLKTSDGGSTQSYYGFPRNSRDIGDLIDFKDMNYNIGNIFKACYRLGEKQGTSKAYDLRKIMFFATRELEKLEGSSTAQQCNPIKDVEPWPPSGTLWGSLYTSKAGDIYTDLPSDVSCDDLNYDSHQKSILR